MIFKQYNSAMTVKNMGCSPVIYISQLAWAKISAIIDNSDMEVGWLGSIVEYDNFVYFLEDVYLFKQQVGSVTCEITEEGLTEFGMEILSLPNGDDIYNRMKLWGHSHVHMSVGASQQDDAQMGIFSKSGHDSFIRMITNKRADIDFTIYDYSRNLIFSNVKYFLYVPEINGIEEMIKNELAEKVSKIVYERPAYHAGLNVDWKKQRQQNRKSKKYDTGISEEDEELLEINNYYAGMEEEYDTESNVKIIYDNFYRDLEYCDDDFSKIAMATIKTYLDIFDLAEISIIPNSKDAYEYVTNKVKNIDETYVLTVPMVNKIWDICTDNIDYIENVYKIIEKL